MNAQNIARMMYVSFAANAAKAGWAHDKLMMVAMVAAIVVVAITDIVFEALAAEDERKRAERVAARR